MSKTMATQLRKISAGLHQTPAEIAQALQPDRSFFACPIGEWFPMSGDVTAINPGELAKLVAAE